MQTELASLSTTVEQITETWISDKHCPTEILERYDLPISYEAYAEALTRNDEFGDFMIKNKRPAEYHSRAMVAPVGLAGGDYRAEFVAGAFARARAIGVLEFGQAGARQHVRHAHAVFRPRLPAPALVRDRFCAGRPGPGYRVSARPHAYPSSLAARRVCQCCGRRYYAVGPQTLAHRYSSRNRLDPVYQ